MFILSANVSFLRGYNIVVQITSSPPRISFSYSPRFPKHFRYFSEHWIFEFEKAPNISSSVTIHISKSIYFVTKAQIAKLKAFVSISCRFWSNFMQDM